VRRVFERARDAEGLSKYSFHSLRHSFATSVAIIAGVDYYYLSHIMGHAAISITLDIYADFTPDKPTLDVKKMGVSCSENPHKNSYRVKCSKRH